MFSSANLLFRYPDVDSLKPILNELSSLKFQRLMNPRVLLPVDPVKVLRRVEVSHTAPFTGSANSYELAIYQPAEADAVIGVAGLYQVDFAHSVAEIGVSIISSVVRGRGLGKEAHKRWIEYAFTDLGLQRLTGSAKATNETVLAVAELVGMRREGLLRSHRFVDGRRVDIVLFGILRSEWIAQNKVAEPS